MSQLEVSECVGCGDIHAADEPCPDGTVWHGGTVRCRMCGHEHASVWPSSIVDETRQECPACGHLTCEPVEEGEPCS